MDQMATNQPGTLDSALMRPTRLDRNIEFSLPDLEGPTHVFKIPAHSMNVEIYTRLQLLAQLCPNNTGVEIYPQRLVYLKSPSGKKF